MAEVSAMTGAAVEAEQPLMAAGLDSRGAMELRRALGEALGMQLPVTLLYDYQSVSEIVEFIDSHITDSALAGAGAESTEASDAEDATGNHVAEQHASEASNRPSKLLKTLRGPAAVRPLFLAAPGVANAQSAYFSFSRYLAWSSQPIYVLEKDNALNIAQLARRNAEDIVKVQREGPYLLGGHSYGGAVAVEIALVLESWGRHVALLLVMDTPLPAQVRTLQPAAEAASDDDVLELLEMILGAMGRDALGMGAGLAHPRESPEWRGMDLRQKLEFFAPIWRVMRDENMTVEQVGEQVRHVALAVKAGTSVSDLRHHAFAGRLARARMVYFRAAAAGACTYFDDRRDGALPHGVCWADVCPDLEVVDVPGDHFSLLRQEPADMAVLVAALQSALAPYGWTPQEEPRHRPYTMSKNEVKGVDAYLQRMGVADASVRARVEGALPWTDPADINAHSGSGTHSFSGPLEPLNAAARSLMRLAEQGQGHEESSAEHTAPLFVVTDGAGGLGPQEAALREMEQPCFALHLPEDVEPWELMDVRSLAARYLSAMRAVWPAGPCLLGGIGYGTGLAYELGIFLQAAGTQVQALIAWEDPVHERIEVLQRAPWFCGAALLARCCPRLDLATYATHCAGLTTEQEQLDYMYSLRPGALEPSTWMNAIRKHLATPAEPDTVGQEATMTWTALWHLLTAAQPADLPTLPVFITRLAHMRGAEEQLDAVAALRPAGRPQEAWDAAVSSRLFRAAYLRHLTGRHAPAGLLHTEVLLMSTRDVETGIQSLLAGWAAGALGSIAPLLAPLRMCHIPSDQGGPPASLPASTSSSILSLTSTVQHAVSPGQQLQQTIAAAVAEAEGACSVRRQLICAADSSVSVPREAAGNGWLAVVPLNSMCPEHSAEAPRASATSSAGTLKTSSRQPAWILHSEVGDAGGASIAFGAALLMPAYGLVLRPAAAAAPSLTALAAAYAEAVAAMQPVGSILLIGISIAGCIIASAMTAHLEAAGRKPLLVLLDGCAALPPQTDLHEPTWYALFYLLRNQGTLTGSIGMFVDHIRGASTMADQLRLLNTYRPSEVSEEAWALAVHATLDRAAILRRLLRRASPPPVTSCAVISLMPRGRLGVAFRKVNRSIFRGSRQTVVMDCGHTEALISARARDTVVQLMRSAIEQLLTSV